MAGAGPQIANVFGNFLKGYSRSRAMAQDRDNQAKQERVARAQDVFKMAFAPGLQDEERDRLYQAGQDLLAVAEQPTPKSQKKQNPVMSILSALNPFAKRERPEHPFEAAYQNVMGGQSSAPKGGSQTGGIFPVDIAGELGGEARHTKQASNVPGPTLGSAQGAVNPLAAGMFRGGPSATPDLGTAGATQPTMAPAGQTPNKPYRSRFFAPDEKRQAAEAQQQAMAKAREGLKMLSQYVQQKGIKTKEDLFADTNLREVIGEINLLAKNADFTMWDEPEEIVAALGLPAARSAKDAFDEDYYGLQQKILTGKATPEQEKQFEKMRVLKNPPTQGKPDPDVELWGEIQKKYTTTGPDGQPVVNKTAAWREFNQEKQKFQNQASPYFTQVEGGPQGEPFIYRMNTRTGQLEVAKDPVTGQPLRKPSRVSYEQLLGRSVPDPVNPQARMENKQALSWSKIKWYADRGEMTPSEVEGLKGGLEKDEQPLAEAWIQSRKQKETALPAPPSAGNVNSRFGLGLPQNTPGAAATTANPLATFKKDYNLE